MAERRGVLFQGSDEQWYWHVLGANNEIMTNSEGYMSLESAKESFTSLFPDLPYEIDER